MDTASPTAATGMAIKGNVHGGQQPVVGAHVYLMAAATTGYSQPSVSLLVPSSTGNSDSVGGYVLTGSDGSFNITGDYTCTPNTQVYLYALGGNPGAGPNSAAGFLSALGNCPAGGSFASSVPFIYINEVSTVAAAYAMSGYAVDATHVASSGSPLAQTGIANAFAASSNLVGLSTGVALTTTPAGNGVVPQKTINTIANILTSCVNSTGPTSSFCTTLFSNAKAQGAFGTAPTDTASAAINIAHNPGNAVNTLYGIVTGSPAFSPSLTSAPNDFTLPITYGGVGGSGANNGAYSIAIDALGDAWFVNVNNNSVSKFSATGAPLSPANGFTSANLFIPAGIAIDLSGNAWVVDSGSSNIVELSPSGSVLGTFNGGGLVTPQDIAIDGSGNVWAVNFPTNSLSKFNSSGTALSPPGAGFTGGNINKPTSLAIDQAGRVWVTNQAPGTGSLAVFSNSGTPLTTTAPFTGGGLNNPQSAAFDNQNNVWIANIGGNSVSLFSSTGAALSPTTGYTGGGLSKPYTLAIDGAGNVWAANSGSSSISELNNAGNPMSPSTGYGLGIFSGPEGIDIDGSGNVWVANTNSTTANTSVIELVGAGVPRVTPTAYGIRTGGLSTRP